MTDQKLVDELEKALTDEAYDGGMGALSGEEFSELVRTLAVTAAEVVEKAHTPTDDEREAWRDEAIRRYPHAEVAKYMRQALQNAFIEGAKFAAGFRRTEVPTCQHGTPLSALCEYATHYASGETDGPHPEHAEPQGEPSDAQAIIVQEVSRLAGMRLLRRYSSFSDTWWDELHAGIARVVRAAGVTHG